MTAGGLLATHYVELRALHVGAVALSLSLFVVRGVRMLAGAAPLRQLRVLPHVVDTVLLASAALLTVCIHQYPFANDWLTAKLLALVAYIALGSIALRRGRTARVRLLTFIAALACAGYMIATAVQHDANPRHWLAAGIAH
jgi:uncharacterized membrane protein SirB2